MKARRITRITLETEETFAFRRSGHLGQTKCSRCGSHSGAVTPDEAASLLRLGVDDIRREIEVGRLHVWNSDLGSIEICLESLQNAAPLLVPGNFKLQINPTQINPNKENRS
ncbi:MAG: hypothetical protein WB679_15875 [Terracidiphilus sp.]